jgi:hypothetical protein
MSTSPSQITIPRVPVMASLSEDLGVLRKIEGGLTDQLFAVVHRSLAPNALTAPLHYHHKEDELS